MSFVQQVNKCECGLVSLKGLEHHVLTQRLEEGDRCRAFPVPVVVNIESSDNEDSPSRAPSVALPASLDVPLDGDDGLPNVSCYFLCQPWFLCPTHSETKPDFRVVTWQRTPKNFNGLFPSHMATNVFLCPMRDLYFQVPYVARASSLTTLSGASDSGGQAAQTHAAESDNSEQTSDMSISSLNSSEKELLSDLDEPSTAGGFGLRGLFGKHGQKHREAIQKIIPYLKQCLQCEGALAKSDKDNVREAMRLANQAGLEPCWGPGLVYKSKRNVEKAIINLYYNSVVTSLHET